MRSFTITNLVLGQGQVAKNLASGFDIAGCSSTLKSGDSEDFFLPQNNVPGQNMDVVYTEKKNF